MKIVVICGAGFIGSLFFLDKLLEFYKFKF